jgi:N6-adenosine-specific RNA methylase IME4
VKKYPTIVADPPWKYDSDTQGADGPRSGAIVRTVKRDGSLANGVRDHTYDRLSVAEIAALPIGEMAEKNAHLYLWTTNQFMVEAHDIARAWGFKPKTICTWVKTHQKDRDRVSMKTGYYFRGATEHFLFCVRGSLRLQVSEGLPTAYLWPRLPHSVKPEAFYDLVEKASPGPFLELFARRNRLGWHTWGNESLVHEEIA